MASPVAIPRVTPAGVRLDDGHQALISFGTNASLPIWEKDVGIPGMDGGDPVETTTQWNEDYRTFAPRQLVTLTEFQVVAAYDPCAYEDLLALINVVDNITIYFPDTSTLAFWGYLRLVEFSPLVEGEQPTLTLTITPTNYDACNCVEAGPVLDCNGTCTC